MVYYKKDTTWEQPDGRDEHKSQKLPFSLWVLHSPQISRCSPTWELSNIILLASMETSLHRHDWSNHWPLAVNSVYNLSPSPHRSRGQDWKFQLSNRMAGSPGNQPPLLSRRYCININSGVVESSLLWISRFFLFLRFCWRESTHVYV